MNKTHKDYKYYGGRGIKICQRWDSYAMFLEDVGERPSGQHSIDRIDNNKDYSPENCRWATKVQQMRNTRRNRVITAFGETACLSEACAKRGSGYDIVRARLNNGWSAEDALSVPVRHLFRKKA